MELERISNSQSLKISWIKPTNVIKGRALRRKKVIPNNRNNEPSTSAVRKVAEPSPVTSVGFKNFPKPTSVHIKRKHKKDKQKSSHQSDADSVKQHAVEKEPQTYIMKESVSERVFTESGKKFGDLDIHRHLVSNLEKINFTTLTTVQEKVIPILLSGKDMLVRSQTGSGKTLAYAVPIIDALQSLTPRLKRTDGVQVMVVVPTRELALQTHELFKSINTFQWIVTSHLCGGESRKSEKDRLRKGVHVLIGTPGRLLDHMFHTSALKVNSVRCLILDEADQLLDMGFRRDIDSLVEELNKSKAQEEYQPLDILKHGHRAEDVEETEGFSLKNPNSKNRQTILLSASLSQDVKELAEFVLREHTFVDALDGSESGESLVIPDTIKHFFIMSGIKNRLVLLSAMIAAKSKQNSKIFIFMASTQMVEFHYELFTNFLQKVSVNSDNVILDGVGSDDDSDLEGVLDTKFFKLHGSMDQKMRKQVFTEFRAAKSGVLLCTDVAARGIDVPAADCVIQYTGPQTDKDYLHRVGRTGRVGKSGTAIIFLTPEEEEYIPKLGALGVQLKRLHAVDFLNCLCEIMSEPDYEKAGRALQQHYENAINENKNLRYTACMAYSTWSRFYNSYPSKMRAIFDFKRINLGHYATSFGLRYTPSEIGKIVRGQVENIESPRLNQKLSNYTDGAQEKKKKVKRAIGNISEFDSGLQPLKKKKKKS
ncbi:hypothetical protein PPYR_04513 [Photinus pyralis]|uniref:ATP-dependent RNA helicase n=1 Tax=Photinus pyralis TaxID=7054 RepID=A0A5N4AYA4_PHOPY|nr:probable ATP-dependent RNA helicase CG8611 [Photinus pyralis]XP_031333691.1 probable ATP-dependent RNA helicase CG8611 [Photinus pyralis]XP_031333693.1 probable ATP-dependent RNA helicase CG8611 [Photinus pyralis]KAB0802327.1 hypothetical protein PPYR_04513 [Photinus pyralis]